MNMLQVQVNRFGGPDVLIPRRVPDPAAGSGQVVVATVAADVLLVDTLIRSGHGVDYFPVRPPYVPGDGVAGHVIEVGDGVDRSWTGRAVVARTGGRGGGSGGYTERAVVPAADLIPVPPRLGLLEAAALLHDGTTAFGLLDAAVIKPGDWVLITAAGGGMGVLLVQLARAADGRVIAAARGGAKLGLVKDVGAEAAIDYSEPDWTERVRELTAGRGADVVFDGAGGELGRAAFEVTAPGGQFFAHGMSGGGFARLDAQQAGRRGITVHGIEQAQYEPATARRLAGAALAEAAAGRLRPVIGQTFPLDRAADAHSALAARAAVAKTLLIPA
jgi:NADPH:quinone reductase